MMHTDPGTTERPISVAAKRLSIATAVITLFMAAMDSTAVAVLLPEMNDSLGHPELYAWIMSGYLLAVTLVAPFTGALSDRLGALRLLRFAIALFGLTSAGAALAHSMPGLIFARILQGIAGGMIIVLDYSLLGTLFAPELRGRMQGLLSSVWGLAAVLGPALGAAVSICLGWRYVFWLNVPVALACLAVLSLATRDTPAPGDTTDIDLGFLTLLGIVTLSAMLLLSQQTLHLTAFMRLALTGSLTLAGIALMNRIRRISQAARVFSSQPELLVGLALIFISSAGLYGSVTLLPLYLQQTEGGHMLGSAGTVMLAAIGWALGSALCGNLLERIGYRLAALAGALLLMGGAIMLVVPAGASPQRIAPMAEALLGFGIGFVSTTSLVLAQNSAPQGRIGRYTAAVQFLRNLGSAVGINALAAIHLARGGQSSNAYHETFFALTLLMAPTLLLALMLPGRRNDKILTES